jgi:phospholipase C
MYRRDFLQQLLAGALPLPATLGTRSEVQSTSLSVSLPPPEQSGIDHIVVVTMENRSFDHLLGWLPGSEGRQSSLSYTDRAGHTIATYPLPPDYTGCGHPVPDHSYQGGRAEYSNGAMDGFLRAGQNDRYAIGFYSASDLPFLAALAQSYRAYDHWFAPFLGPTYPNRMFLWSAQTDRLNQSLKLSRLSTIFDRLTEARVSHRYYFSTLPFLALWGFKYFFSAALFSDFLSDAAAGTLPAVSFVDPAFSSMLAGVGNNDEPPADVRNGEAFLSQIFRALAMGPKWAHTVLIITFDEWGGFFDHVPPPRVIAPNDVDPDVVNGEALLGFRIPVVMASPFTWGGGIDHTLYDNTSILKLIEWRWNLPPLTGRDASSVLGNPVTSFYFGSPVTSFPIVPETLPVPSSPCLEALLSRTDRVRQGEVSPGVSQQEISENTAFAELARSPVVQQWLHHPRFQGKLQRSH